jgi:iron-sulfur cluster repair protein YtfE (RIC family)
MDPLINLSEAHRKLVEMPLMYQKILTTVNFIDVVEYVKSLNRLFRETLTPHFDFEETQIFPIFISRGDSELESLISALIQEHKQFMEKLAQINELSTKLESDPNTTQKDKDKLVALCTEITQKLTEHAHKEDERLFPYL